MARSRLELDVREVAIDGDGARLEGTLTLPVAAGGLVLFAHGSGSSRHSPRNSYVADVLNGAGIGTLVFDLLTAAEDRAYQTRFDIGLLTARLLAATRWARSERDVANLPIGYFGASTGAAAALQAAAHGGGVRAVVSRGGRPDLAGAEALSNVTAATLLLVGGRDEVVIELNRVAFAVLRCEKTLTIVPGATHLFEEPGTLEQVAQAATVWFRRWLAPARG